MSVIEPHHQRAIQRMSSPYDKATHRVFAAAAWVVIVFAAACSSDGAADSAPSPANTVTVEVCPNYLEECDARCTDTNVDPNHCGACGMACADGEACADGQCQAPPSACPSEQVLCEGKCIDPKTDPVHCGASGDCQAASTGVACAAGEKCSDGACVLSCQDGLVNCGGTCIDPANNDAHCGASGDCQGANGGVTCIKPEQCIGFGVCGPVCSASEIACSGTCVDPMTDQKYCGASADCMGQNVGTPCSNVEECVQGACKKLAIACTTVTNASKCTQGAIDQITLAKNLTPTQCRDQCQMEMPLKGMTSGCWVIASDTFCYCRSGQLILGGQLPGGVCTKP